jgi:hypothetical protein
MRYLLAAGLFLILTLNAATAATCRDDAVQEATSPYLIAKSGWTFKLFPGNDLRISGTWLPMDRLTICRLGGSAYEITNLDRHGEHTIGVFEN